MKLWSVYTTGLLLECSGGEDQERALQARKDKVKDLAVDVKDVLRDFVRFDADEREYMDELEDIIQRSIEMDRDICGQAADVTWNFGNTRAPTPFNEGTMALERGEKASAARDVTLVITPALYKLGKSNGDDFDQPAQLLLPSEVTCRLVHDGQTWGAASHYAGR